MQAGGASKDRLVTLSWYFHLHVYCCLVSALQATLFVKHPTTGKIYLNLDPAILQLLAESEILSRMELEVPTSAYELCLIGDDLKKNFYALKVLVNRQCVAWLLFWNCCAYSLCSEITRTVGRKSQHCAEI